jgi:hypothetical protein
MAKWNRHEEMFISVCDITIMAISCAYNLLFYGHMEYPNIHFRLTRIFSHGYFIITSEISPRFPFRKVCIKN